MGWQAVDAWSRSVCWDTVNPETHNALRRELTELSLALCPSGVSSDCDRGVV